jgi:hypothetical protein
MDVGVELRCFGMRQENRRFSESVFYKKLRSKVAWLGRTFESHNQDKRDTLILGGEK